MGMTVLTVEDIDKLTEEIKQLKEIVTKMSQVVLGNQESSVSNSCSNKRENYPTSVEELENYVDNTIRSANIENMTEEELDKLKSKQGTYYIYDIVYKFAKEDDLHYLKSAKYGRGVKKIDIWMSNPRFHHILQYCLPQYIDKYLKKRYSNLEKLEQQRDRALKAVEAIKEIEKFKVRTPQEFKVELDSMIRDVKRTKAYENDYLVLVACIKAATNEVGHAEIDECYKAYYKENVIVAKRDLDVIGYIPKHANTFLLAFKKAASDLS